MDQQNITPDSTERFVPAQFIRNDGTIETFPGYVVSDRGRIASMKGKVMKILKPHLFSKYGHMKVTLCINSKTYQRSVHRLILSSFHAELWSKDTNEVDHKDRNPTINSLNNLHWVNKNENYTNRAWNPLKQIRVTHLSDGHVEMFDNMQECSRAFGKSCKWCNQMIYRHNGFNAKYNILIEKIS